MKQRQMRADNKPAGLPVLRQTLWMAGLLGLWLVITACFIGMRAEHWLLALLVATMFLASGGSRRLVVALLPFLIFAITYDWMNLWHNFQVNPHVDIRGVYEAEKYLFGISTAAGRLTPNEYFALHHWAAADLMAGVFYLCWVPLPILFGVWLYCKGQRETYLHFAIAFLMVNLIGFVCYYVHPAAPPWYVASHGFDFLPGTCGEVGGLGRFDQMTHWHVFEGLYSRNANVFAAIPSLHSAYTPIAFYYSLKSKCPKWMRALLAVVSVGIWCTAVYSSHHYIIDVTLGIACAALTVFLLEGVLMRLGGFKKFILKYVSFISDGREGKAPSKSDKKGKSARTGRLQKIRLEYRNSLKSMDTEESFDLIFYRPIGYAWASLAKKLGISPNAITIASILLGVAAGVLFYYPRLWINVLGMILLVWANSFDSADGQLARMTNRYSQLGRILDGLSGDFWFLAIYLAIAIRMNHFGGFFSEYPWLIWIVAVLAGISHTKQAAMADYYRQFHLSFVKKGPSELTSTDRLDRELAAIPWKGNFWKKSMTAIYRHYTANQEVLTPNMQRLRRRLETRYRDRIPQAFSEAFRIKSLPLMKYTNMLTFNTRVFALFIALFIGMPWLYFAFELTVLNCMLAYMMIRHERMCARFATELEKAEGAATGKGEESEGA